MGRAGYLPVGCVRLAVVVVVLFVFTMYLCSVADLSLLVVVFV